MVMRRAHLALIALGIVGATGLAGCGKFQKPQRAAWRDQAEAACMASREVQFSSYVSLRGKAIDGPGTCGMQQPLKVSAFSGGGIGLTSSATLSCPIVATTDKWLAEVVQPAAMNVLGAQVIELRAGSYSCRAMNNGTGTSRTSEHVFVGAGEHFSTGLGPGAAPSHYDHFHIDLARHPKGRRICKPMIKYTPNYNLPPPDPTRPYSMAQTQPRGAAPPAGTVVAGGGLLRQPGDGLRPPGAVQGGYPVASYAQGQPRSLDSQQRFLEQYDARQRQGHFQPQPLPSENRGPLTLPGAVPPTEEAVLGDEGGTGVVDIEGEDQAQPMITPQRDPFAYSSGRVPPRR